MLVAVYLFGFAEFAGISIYGSGDHLAGMALALSGLGPLAVGVRSVYKMRAGKNSA